ncbi:acetyltransferase (GNAT) family protein [mine drainage metagenome]|jgi:GNAT superfamily N-acetyltransferase|uniref:Acetyltransferase (GNAT) family protein n=1 Tax=mine drainage metagenome TaxID=410659 RepID=A0A1J5QRD2_9ZZZZ
MQHKPALIENGADAPAAEAAEREWWPDFAPSARLVPIRPLGAGERDALRAHFVALEAADRYLRFGYAASDEQVLAYVDGIDFTRDEIYGVFNRKLELIAAAHLAVAADGRAEFGVSVLPSARGKGIGTRLFERAAMHARNRGIECMTMQCLTQNAPMVRIARRAGMQVHVCGGETEGVLRVPHGSLLSHLDEWLADATGEIDFAIKLGRHRTPPTPA